MNVSTHVSGVRRFQSHATRASAVPAGAAPSPVRAKLAILANTPLQPPHNTKPKASLYGHGYGHGQSEKQPYKHNHGVGQEGPCERWCAGAVSLNEKAGAPACLGAPAYHRQPLPVIRRFKAEISILRRTTGCQAGHAAWAACWASKSYLRSGGKLEVTRPPSSMLE